MKGLTFWPFYLAPTLIAWYRARHGKAVIGSVGYVFFNNLVFGWTGVMWLLMLANAFGRNPVAWLAVRLVKVVPTGQAGSAPQAAAEGSQAATCSQCAGSGSTTCSSCWGRGSWYDPPQGEHGVAQLNNCHACMSSGRLRCMACGGTGRVVY